MLFSPRNKFLKWSIPSERYRQHYTLQSRKQIFWTLNRTAGVWALCSPRLGAGCDLTKTYKIRIHLTDNARTGKENKAYAESVFRKFCMHLFFCFVTDLREKKKTYVYYHFAFINNTCFSVSKCVFLSAFSLLHILELPYFPDKYFSIIMHYFCLLRTIKIMKIMKSE